MLCLVLMQAVAEEREKKELYVWKPSGRWGKRDGSKLFEVRGENKRERLGDAVAYNEELYNDLLPDSIRHQLEEEEEEEERFGGGEHKRRGMAEYGWEMKGERGVEDDNNNPFSSAYKELLEGSLCRLLCKHICHSDYRANFIQKIAMFSRAEVVCDAMKHA